MNSNNLIAITHNNSLFFLNLDKFLNELSLHLNISINSIIRIKKEEFDTINKSEGFFTHFNLRKSNHKCRNIYILPRIEKQRYSNGEEEILPILNFEDAPFYECIGCREEISYSSLVKDDFKYSMAHITNKDELFKVIWKRYSVSRPYLSQEEMYSKGVSVTKLKKIELQTEIDNKLLSKIIEKLK